MARTSGLQPGRRLFHAANGVLIAGALTFLPISRTFALTILAAVLAAQLLFDLARLASPRLNRLFFRAFPSLVSPREARRIASSTWYVLGVMLALLFPRPQAVAGILVLALADPAAVLAGRRWGRRRWGTGTVVGSLTFAATAFLIVMLLGAGPWWSALLTACLAAWVERTAWPLDDNLVLPPLVAGLLTLMRVAG